MHRECEQCGGPIPDRMRVSTMFCSRQCANDHFNGLEAAARLEAKQGRAPCIECGAPIPVEKPAGTRFCNDNICGQRHRKRLAAVARDCALCGAPFRSHNPGRRFCGKSCATRAMHAAHGRADRRAEIAEAIRQNPGASDRAIGRIVGACHKTVWRIRRAQPAANPRCGGGG